VLSGILQSPLPERLKNEAEARFASEERVWGKGHLQESVKGTGGTGTESYIISVTVLPKLYLATEETILEKAL